MEKKLKQKQRELECTRKRIRRLEENRGRANQAQKRRERLVTVSKRKRMGTLVETFLHRDDITTVINGKAGEMRKGGQIFRKRYLTDTMENLHKKFIGENPTLKISRSQFCKHRPFWIVSPRVTDRETCGCKIHENFNSKVKKLHQLGITRTMSSTEVVASSVCDAVDIDCMYNRCDKCKKATFPVEMNPNTKDNIVSWEEWVSRSTPVTKKHQDGSTSEFEVKNTILEKKFASIERLVDLTKEDLPRFCTHLYNIGHQFTRLKMLKDSLTEDQVVVHVDYSENYNCKWSKEIKDTHFGWSHQQYRNKTAFYLASTVPFLKGFKAVTWNFTEASHSKGAPDGVGGALKNLADRMVAYGTDIPDAHALMENLSKQTSVKLFEVTEEKITTSGELVPPSLKTVPGTMKVHQLVATEPGKIRTRDVSCFCSPSCDCFSPREFIFCPKEVEVEESHKKQDPTIEVGTWILVDYDGDLYPGSVTQVC
ncbi:hypothetical protein SKAU_G00097050 [Synaphobranchus kaupii]|uniref:Uncharacterized protein n=1 Tax=Synaphobranchus kaupii TaxID=118154 RepID=A0A9Q1J604_SYNKA|nr:hypothetical protein SKAU_G00097050 [Synaphobranchus kaupii]